MEKLSKRKIHIKRFVFIATFIFISLFTVTLCIYAEDSLVKSLSLPNAQAYQPYSEKIEMKDETEHYTFALASNSLIPAGLSVSEDGVISGTPTTSGTYYAIKIKITDSLGKSVTKKFSMRVKARDIRIKVLVPNPAPYDGQPHDATVECYDNVTGELIENLNPKVTYGTGRTEHAIEAGTHIVNITAPSGCRIVNNVTRTVTIEPLPVNEFSVEGYTVPYDGQPHGITAANVTVDPAEAGYAVEYRRQGTSAYTSDEPVLIGAYDVRIHTNNTNYVTQYASATIIIEGEKVKFDADNNTFTYTGEGQAPTVTATKNGEAFSDYTVSYTTSTGESIAETDLKDGKPYKPGTYRININFNELNRYTVDSFTNNTFTISKQEVTLKIPQKTYYKAGEDNLPIPQTPVVVAEPEGFTGYTAQYQRLAEDGTPVGEPSDQVSEIGTYKVIFTLNDPDNYTFGTGNAQYVEVASKVIDFTFTDLEKTYKRDTAQYATVTATGEGEIFDSHYQVVYTQNNILVNEPKKVGRYYITIKPKHGHGVGTKNPEFPYLVINPQVVTFSVAQGEETAVDFDGNDHEVQVTKNDDADIADNEYEIKYRNKETNVETDAANAVGEYDIVVNVTNSNYQAANEVIGTFTVNTTYELEMGNSPAAMIFKDNSKTDEQKQSIFEEFKVSREFTAENVPAGCQAGIKYPVFVPVQDDCDLDMDPSTVILNDISDYQEPGIKINGEEIEGGVLEAVEGIDNLYTVTYNGDSSLKRYVVVVNGRIGDVTGEGLVNAIDANYLDALDRSAQTINEARFWDVNKDGNIDRLDATAIRRRFSEKLIPYYPWV